MSTMRVLVIDDSVADFELIGMSMRQTLGDSFVLDHALTLGAAADLIGDNEYAVIIHDLYLPPAGPESIVETYKIAGNTPIVAISGQSSPDMHRTALSNGAALFCSKSDLKGENLASILAQAIPGMDTEQP